MYRLLSTEDGPVDSRSHRMRLSLRIALSSAVNIDDLLIDVADDDVIMTEALSDLKEGTNDHLEEGEYIEDETNESIVAKAPSLLQQILLEEAGRNGRQVQRARVQLLRTIPEPSHRLSNICGLSSKETYRRQSDTIGNTNIESITT